ncbi:MAG: hypothetical protein JOZ69_07880 [Myxococcales bacterium]|nr:hypothetical protein [Myxococcales bacterium]
MIVRSLLVLTVLASCARASAPPSNEGSSPGDLGATARATGTRVAAGEVGGDGGAAGSAIGESVASADGQAGAPNAPAASVPIVNVAAATDPRALAAEPADGGEDFTAEARILFRVAACGATPTDEAPPRFDPAVIARHCDDLGRAYREYEHGWVDVATPFIAALRPKDLPRTVVYPFGGGDLASALATYPDALEITTISLEPAGDVRPIDTLPPDRLSHELAEHRSHLERLFEKAHSRTDNLEKESKSDLPGEVIFALAALAVYGDEPVGLRYFRLRPDGTIAYVTKADIEAAKTPADRRALFANVELRFRRAQAGAGQAGTAPAAGPGSDAGSASAAGPVRVMRHISFNLDDAHLKADPSLLAHLSAKGRVATMTKAASHLLWNDQFSRIRGWLLEHTDWMISDSTGLPPRFAAPAGFQQDTYGVFAGPAPFGLLNPRDAADFRHLFASQPPRELPFRYGYPDRDGHAHMVVTQRIQPGASADASVDGGAAATAPDAGGR